MSSESTYVDGSGECENYASPVFPTEPIVAATFNKELVEREGELMGEQSLWSNTVSIYGPGLNLHRSPYCGRNHEYYSEDSMLTNLLGIRLQGWQEQGPDDGAQTLCFQPHGDQPLWCGHLLSYPVSIQRAVG